jgi:hypothetical protein
MAALRCRPLAIAAAAVGIAAAGGLPALLASSGQAQAPTTLLTVREPIEAADQRLQQQGWRPISTPPAESFDRELSGNGLISLRACSGTGMGYCRYDYRRGDNQLEVITVPSSDGDGQVVRWSLGSGGGPWGLCQTAPLAPLLPCSGTPN